MIEDIIHGEFHCPRCRMIMREIRPTEDKLLLNKEYIVRLLCSCGHYEDKVVKPENLVISGSGESTG